MQPVRAADGAGGNVKATALALGHVEAPLPGVIVSEGADAHDQDVHAHAQNYRHVMLNGLLRGGLHHQVDVLQVGLDALVGGGDELGLLAPGGDLPRPVLVLVGYVEYIELFHFLDGLGQSGPDGPATDDEESHRRLIAKP